MRYRILLFVLLLLSLAGAALIQRPAQAQSEANDLLNEVNALRAAYGLPPLQADSALMSAAQSQSDFQASIGSVTHSGLGGSRPRDRAIAAGYGAGDAIFISENVAGGADLSASLVVHSSWSDSLNMSTLLGPAYTHAGAGAATAGGVQYYTLVVGYVAGAPAQQTTPQAGQPTRPAATTSPTSGLQTGAPLPDGSVVHDVQPGEALWSIAIAYGIQIEDILRLNALPTNAVVWAGDKLIVAPSYTPTLPPTETNTPPPPTRTATSTRTPRPPTFTASPAPTLTFTPQPFLPPLPTPQSENRRSLGIGLIVVCALGIVVVLLNNLKKS